MSGSNNSLHDFLLEDQESVTTGSSQPASLCHQGLLFHFFPNKDVCFPRKSNLSSSYTSSQQKLPKQQSSTSNRHSHPLKTISGVQLGAAQQGKENGKSRGCIVVINTSQSTEGICVWACSEAYVDPAVAFRSYSTPACIHNSLLDWNSSSHSQRLVGVVATVPLMLCREESGITRKEGWSQFPEQMMPGCVMGLQHGGVIQGRA